MKSGAATTTCASDPRATQRLQLPDRGLELSLAHHVVTRPAESRYHPGVSSSSVVEGLEAPEVLHPLGHSGFLLFGGLLHARELCRDGAQVRVLAVVQSRLSSTEEQFQVVLAPDEGLYSEGSTGSQLAIHRLRRQQLTEPGRFLHEEVSTQNFRGPRLQTVYSSPAQTGMPSGLTTDHDSAPHAVSDGLSSPPVLTSRYSWVSASVSLVTGGDSARSATELS